MITRVPLRFSKRARRAVSPWTSEGVARRRMGQNNDLRVHHSQERGALLNVLKITTVAVFLARQGTIGTPMYSLSIDNSRTSVYTCGYPKGQAIMPKGGEKSKPIRIQCSPSNVVTVCRRSALCGTGMQRFLPLLDRDAVTVLPCRSLACKDGSLCRACREMAVKCNA